MTDLDPYLDTVDEADAWPWPMRLCVILAAAMLIEIVLIAMAAAGWL